MDDQRIPFMPDEITEDEKSVCVLATWVTGWNTELEEGGRLIVSIKTQWEDPGAWGIVLVDIARHVARAYSNDNVSEEAVLSRVRELMEAEFDKFTTNISGGPVRPWQ